MKQFIINLRMNVRWKWSTECIKNVQSLARINALSHALQFFATSNAILLLRDLKMANTCRHYILLISSSYIKHYLLINIYFGWLSCVANGNKPLKVATCCFSIALMQVFPKPIVLTTKPRIDAKRSLHI